MLGVPGSESYTQEALVITVMGPGSPVTKFQANGIGS